MATYIYVPFDAFRRSSWLADATDFFLVPHNIIGYHIGNSYVVVDIVKDVKPEDVALIDPDLRVIGYTNQKSGAQSEHKHLYLRFHSLSRLPFVDSSFYHSQEKFVIIFFAPPNIRNLEYFTVRPILLQSTDMALKSESFSKNILKLHIKDNCRLSRYNEIALERVNECSRLRSELLAQYTVTKACKNQSENRLITLVGVTKKFLLKNFVSGVGVIIMGIVWAITYLNTQFLGKKPVERSTWCRQLDLRLRQVSFFPFQFLSYYDTDFLKANVREQLGIPMSNERYNINNSNYINLYNTIWLIINDILIGRTIYRIVAENLPERIGILNNTLFSVCFTKLNSFISWIGSEYPGGFKLNTDLGQFMELLFLWTSQLCADIFTHLVASPVSNSWFIALFTIGFKISCFMGASFITGFFIDYIQLVNVHISLFCLSATKIYHRQIEMLKSLMQLFRGRKYNILRSRIDKIEEDQLRIDQLLLGTFVFLVLIYLLPTIFAFYFLFYSVRVVMKTFLKFGEKLILCLDLFPLFVILLKLKNSRRLQGGIHFTHKGHHETTEWVIMKNKALTFDEIFRNFIHVFRQEGRFERLIFNFFEGIDLQVRDSSSEKLQYLMLPKNHTSLTDVWESVAKKIRTE